MALTREDELASLLEKTRCAMIVIRLASRGGTALVFMAFLAFAFGMAHMALALLAVGAIVGGEASERLRRVSLALEHGAAVRASGCDTCDSLR